MNWYIYTQEQTNGDRIVYASIPEWDVVLPGVPINDRIHADILNQCILSDAEIAPGWLYDGATFSAPTESPEPAPDPSISEQLTDLQTAVVDYEYRLILLELGMEGGNV